MSEELFCNKSSTIEYILKNQIKKKILIDIFANGFDFINEKFAKIICKILEIQL